MPGSRRLPGAGSARWAGSGVTSITFSPRSRAAILSWILAMIANIQERIAARERGEKVIDVTPEPAHLALPAPGKRRDPGIYEHADTALGTQASDKRRAEKRK